VTDLVGDRIQVLERALRPLAALAESVPLGAARRIEELSKGVG
jgi:hypothetical protein